MIMTTKHKSMDMNFKDKFYFKLRLDLGLMTIKEIQDWANDKILIDHNHQVALDICFLKDNIDIQNYVEHLVLNSENKHVREDKQLVALQVLKEYFENKLPKVLDNQLDFHVSNLRYIVQYLNDVGNESGENNLDSYIIGYDDQIALACLGLAGMSPQEAYDFLYYYLDDWIKKFVL